MKLYEIANTEEGTVLIEFDTQTGNRVEKARGSVNDIMEQKSILESQQRLLG